MSRWIQWAPSPVDELTQNVRTILKTGTGTVPFARALGTSQELLDTPQSVAAARMGSEAIAAVRTYEPRVKIEAVTWQADADGKLAATATLGAP